MLTLLCSRDMYQTTALLDSGSLIVVAIIYLQQIMKSLNHGNFNFSSLTATQAASCGFCTQAPTQVQVIIKRRSSCVFGV